MKGMTVIVLDDHRVFHRQIIEERNGSGWFPMADDA